MKYKKIVSGIFRARPNRFIAHVEIDGQLEVCHVKNTGRCRELLLPGATVFLEVADNPNRKTKYDLIGVKKKRLLDAKQADMATPYGETAVESLLVNMDSQAPNIAVGEWLRAGNLFPDATLIKGEKTYKKSRFDFYIETPDVDGSLHKIFLEVKGVTLENDGVVSFPDAPTERGVKHIEELVAAMEDGYEAYILFVVQMEGMKYFRPNDETHPAFGDALRKAARAGVQILAYECNVTEDEMMIAAPIKVVL